ncbi:MAG: hypothetical protein U0105_09700 [Candidatus Obscuribacterales bacterium]
MTSRLPPKLREATPPKKRLARERELASELDDARRLLKAKNYRQAFAKYKAIFSSPEGAEFFLSRAEITKLSKNHPPALVTLKRWRNQKEKLIEMGKADSEVVRDWQILNVCLKEPQRTLAVFDKLKNSGCDEEVLDSILWHIWKQLLRARRYEDLRGHLRTLGWLTILHVGEYDADIWFPRKLATNKEAAARWTHAQAARIRDDGALTFEIALALKETLAANMLKEKILSVDSSDLAYSALIKAAVRARDYGEASDLYDAAKSALGSRRVRHSTQAVKRIPKSAKVTPGS